MLWLSCVLVVCSLTGRAAPPKAPPVDVFLSAGDSWWFGTWLPVDSAGSIHDSVQMWNDVLNVKRIYWRGEQEEMMIDYGLIREQNLEYAEFFNSWERHLMKDEHLNQKLVTEAHGHGMEVYLWAPLFDYGGPADNGGCKEYPYYGQLNLTLQHPEWMPIDRYGVRAQNGPIELAYPAARRALIEMYLHYLERDHLDGVTFFTYCENYGLRFEDEFGFSQPIVDEYRRRYGVDIRTQDFDRHLWHYLRGEYATQFLRELKAELKKRGMKLGVRLNPREPNQTDRWNVPAYILTSGRIYLDWERWVREGIVDELNVSASAPRVLQERTIENVLQVTRGTPVSVSALTSLPMAERFKPYTARGLRLMLFATDDASYVKLVYPSQAETALAGADVYATIRFLAQVAEGAATAPAERIIPLARHANILVRRQALRALSRLQDPRAVPVLEAALDDPERSVRSAAVFGLQHLHGPASGQKMIAAVHRSREFQVFEAVGTVLAAIDRPALPDMAALASDPDVLMRRLALYVIGRRRDPASVPVLIAGLKDADLFVRFRAAAALQAFPGDPRAVAALLAALQDRDVVIQDRAATSLAIALVPSCTIPPRLGLESSGRIIETKTGPLPEIVLSPGQLAGLDALVRTFRAFGDGSTRGDLEWGFRPMGNAILAFGAEGGRRLQALIDQKRDVQLALLAWQVLYIRQGMENFCPVPGEDAANAAIYATYPTRPLDTKVYPSKLKYDPTDKDN